MHRESAVLCTSQQVKTQVEESKNVGLEKENVMNRARWRVAVGEIAVRVR